MKEVWKPVPFDPFTGKYSVSNLGRVKPNTPSRYSKNGATVLKPLPGTRGYLHVSLYAEGKQRSCFIHRMVCIAFHGPPPFEGAQVCHKDDVKTHNTADNLEWGTGAQNAATRDALGKHGKGENNGHAKLTENAVRDIRRIYAHGGITQQAIAERFNVSDTTVNFIVRRIIWQHVD